MTLLTEVGPVYDEYIFRVQCDNCKAITDNTTVPRVLADATRAEGLRAEAIEQLMQAVRLAGGYFDHGGKLVMCPTCTTQMYHHFMVTAHNIWRSVNEPWPNNPPSASAAPLTKKDILRRAKCY